MNAIKTKSFRALYYYLVTCGLPALIGSVALTDERLAIAFYASACVLSLPVSLLPGRIGRKRSCPLRVPVAVLCSIVIAAAGVWIAIATEVFFPRGLAYGVITGFLFLYAIREECLEFPIWTGHQGAVIGLVVYLIPGVVLTYVDYPVLKNALWIQAVVFLAITAFYLNNQNLLNGLATRNNARPPHKLITGNRLITIVFAAIVAVIVFFDKLRAAATAFGQWIIRSVILLLMWLGSFYPGGSETGGSGGGDGTQEMLAGLGETETSSFWLAAEKVMVVFAILLGAAVVLYGLYYIGKLLAKLARFLRAYFARYAQAATEDYVDEQEDLFDLDDIRERAKEKLRQTLRKITERPPRWEDMDARAKIRFCVKTLYRRAGDSINGLAAMTIREAAPKLPGATEPEQLAELYERARYAENAPDEAEAEKMRKAVKL